MTFDYKQAIYMAFVTVAVTGGGILFAYAFGYGLPWLLGFGR